MEIESFRTPGLGDTTYIIRHEDHAVVVDPQRDIERFLAVLDHVDTGLVLETHLHNDYVSGAARLADEAGATLVLPAAAAPAYRHRPAFHREVIRSGPFSVTPIHTPGHTPEHMSYLVEAEGQPSAVFSGGSLLVGAAGRPDLLGDARADTLARLQYGSVHRLAELPGATGLYPTHGEGSFCATTGAARASSTIAQEVESNPVLQFADEDAFVANQLGGLQPYPSFYAFMGPANTFGYPDPPGGKLPELALDDVPDGAVLVDVRSKAEQGAGRVPGSLGLEAGDQVGVWAGWLLAHDADIVLVAEADQDVESIATQFTQIGMDGVAGVVRNLGDGVVSHRVVDVDTMRQAIASGEATQVLDVRAPNEWANGHLDNSVHCYLPALADAVPAGLDPRSPVWIACGSGYRATAAVKYLEEAGHTAVVLAGGGIPNLL